MTVRHPLPVLLLALTLTGSIALVASTGRRQGGATPRSSPAAPSSPRLLQELSLLATGHLPTDAARELHARLGLEAYVDALLADRDFARTIAPDVLLGWARERPSSAWAALGRLKQIPGGDRPLYFLYRPCEPAEAEVVHPWWAPETEVLVCPDSHRPDRLVHPEHPDWRCSGANLTPENSDFCGCGPNLVFCAGGTATVERIAKSLQAEVSDTVAYVTEHDLPLRALFTMNETVRDGLADFFYQRGRLLSGELRRLPDPHSMPPSGKLRSRLESWPGQHAGILTTYQLSYMTDGLRDRLRDYYMLMWCQDGQSQEVTADAILSLGVTDLRAGNGWQQLAAMPVCTRCHARLDYGMQFFQGQPSTYVSHYPVASLRREGRGPLYGRDIDDARGEAPLTAHGFAELAVDQPEFSNCLVERVSAHVFDYRASVADRKAIEEALRAPGTFQAMMRVALLRYAASRTPSTNDPRSAARDTAPAIAASSMGDSDLLVVPPPLRAQLDTHCMECHEEAPLDFRGRSLPAGLLRRMLPQVAWRVMPKRGMDPSARMRLVGDLAHLLYPESDARAEALWYYRDHRSLPVHRMVTLRSLLSSAAGATVGTPGRSREPVVEALISSDRLQLTPGLAAELLLQALGACRRAGHEGAALEGCIAQVTSPALTAKSSPPPPLPRADDTPR